MLPTIVVADSGTGGGRHNSAGHQDTLPGTIREVAGENGLLPTPTGQNANGNGTNGRGETLLPGVAESLLPTPRATRGGSATETTYLLESDGESRGPLLPTPVVSDSESARRRTTSADAAMHSGSSLGDAVDDLLPTPKAADGEFVSPSTTGRPVEKSTHLGTIALLQAGHLEHRREPVEDLLPTPTAWEQRSDPDVDDRNLLPLEAQRITAAGVPLLPTPTTQESHSGPSQADRNTRPLNDRVLDFLPTPIASDAKGTGPADANRDTTQLRAIDILLPTPVAMEGIKGTSLSPEHRQAGGHQVWLSNVAPTFLEEVAAEVEDPLLPTPTARDHKDSGEFTPHPEKRKLAHTIAGEDIELLPTPSGAVVNDGESAESWQARHDRHAAKGDDATRSGMPLTVALQRVNWGKYGPAIARAEEITGRPAPDPTNPDGQHGKHRLSASFVEWMMLLEEGRVTGHGLSRAKELARLGNGVVPLQAAAAVATLLGRLAADKREARRE